MLKRALIIATAVFAAQAGAAFADNNYTFDDPYWKTAFARGVEKTSYITSQTDPAFAKYDLVDSYNP
jgi:hypothetical protein